MLKYTSLPVLPSIHLAHSRCQILLQIPHTSWIFPFSFLYFFLFLHHAIFFLFQLMLDSLERNVLFLRIFYICFSSFLLLTLFCSRLIFYFPCLSSLHLHSLPQVVPTLFLFLNLFFFFF